MESLEKKVYESVNVDKIKRSLRYLSGVLMGAGIAVVTVNTFFLLDVLKFVTVAQTWMVISPAVLMFIGLLMIILGAAGVTGRFSNNYYPLVIFIYGLSIVLITEAVVGITTAIRKNDFNRGFTKNIKYSMYQYTIVPELDIYFDNIQIKHECCGAFGPGDWANYTLPHPKSCCISIGKEGKCTAGYKTKGCVSVLSAIVNRHTTAVLGVGFAFILVPVIGLVFTCILACRIKYYYNESLQLHIGVQN